MKPYFTVESTPLSGRVTFSELKVRLIKIVNARILNGEFSERGLARILGISQPQVHNVLKGARRLSHDIADRLLTMLGMSVLDLIRQEELEEHSQGSEHIGRAIDGPDLRWHFGMDQRALKKPPTPETGPRKARHRVGN